MKYVQLFATPTALFQNAIPFEAFPEDLSVPVLNITIFISGEPPRDMITSFSGMNIVGKEHNASESSPPTMPSALY